MPPAHARSSTECHLWRNRQLVFSVIMQSDEPQLIKGGDLTQNSSLCLRCSDELTLVYPVRSLIVSSLNFFLTVVTNFGQFEDLHFIQRIGLQN